MNKPRVIRIVLTILLFLVVASILFMAAVPPVSRDALTHHLLVPKLYLQMGRIGELPDIVFSYYPQLLDLLYMPPLAAGWDSGAKYVHFLFGLGTAVLIFFFVRRRLGGLWGLLGVLFYLTLPVIVKLSVTVYVDLGLAFFSTASLFSLVLWIENRQKWRWLVISALACGLALSSKYNGLIVFALLILGVAFFSVRYRPSGGSQLTALKYPLLFGILALLVFSPWMVKNWVWKHNPVYPLYDSFFNGPAAVQKPVDDTPEAALKRQIGPQSHFLIRSLLYGETSTDIALIPLRIFYDGRDDDPRYFDGRLNLLLLLLPLSLLLLPRARKATQPELTVFSLFATLFILIVFFRIDMRIRWILPAVPPLVVLSVYGLYGIGEWLRERSRKLADGAVIALVALFLVPNFSYIPTLFDRIAPLPYLAGKTTRDQYIADRLVEYPMVRFINRNLGSQDRVLAMFLGNRRYYFEVPVSTEYSVINEALENPSGGSACRRLVESGFTHLLIHNNLFREWSDSLPDNQKPELNRFISRCLQPKQSLRGFSLYRLKGAKAAQIVQP